MIQDKKFQKINQEGWNKLVKNNNGFSNTSLPEYGPYMPNEDVLNIFCDIKDKTALELGCGSGKSLEYLSKKGAHEVWGLDISKEQINKALKLNIKNSKFFISEMEVNPGVPFNYFDYVLSLYSVGYSADLEKTLKLCLEYLKSSGKLILCWTHPIFNCLGVKNGNVYIRRSYLDETKEYILKGNDKVKLIQNNFKISTIINLLINIGFEIEKILEENPTNINGIGDYESPYFDERKLKFSPTTLLIIASKKY